MRAMKAAHIQTIEDATQWFRDAKFGMFVHWGLYSMLAGEWKGHEYPWFGEWIMNVAKIPLREYRPLAAQFNPVKFNAKEWVRVAEDAGMKYIVLTAKHHDGFAMFHSRADAYNIVDATPFKRDVTDELAAACSGTPVRLAFYYSQAQDWTEAHAGSGEYGNRWDFPLESTVEGFQEYFERKAIPQVTELLTQYGDIAMIWFDNPLGTYTRTHAEALKTLVRTLQPQCLISNRIGYGIGDIRGFGDNALPDKKVGGCPGESCVTMNDTWGYKKNGGRWKTGEELLAFRNICNERDCNLLLNVGPMGDGAFPPEAIDRLIYFSAIR
jgi:alpha-L-fucosidase